MNFQDKIPNISSLVLTTREECHKTENFARPEDHLVLAFDKQMNFEGFFLSALVIFKIGFKENYSKLTISIDPGNKIGLMIFLDDYYLDSSCCFEKSTFFDQLKFYIEFFKRKQNNDFKFNFKIGTGVISLSQEIISFILQIIKLDDNLIIELIDEYKSSKIKINKKKFNKKLTKDEISALIIAMREGIILNRHNYQVFFNQIPSIKGKKSLHSNLDHEKIKNNLINWREIAEKVIKGVFSLKQAIQMLKELDNVTLSAS